MRQYLVDLHNLLTDIIAHGLDSRLAYEAKDLLRHSHWRIGNDWDKMSHSAVFIRKHTELPILTTVYGRQDWHRTPLPGNYQLNMESVREVLAAVKAALLPEVRAALTKLQADPAYRPRVVGEGPLSLAERVMLEEILSEAWTEHDDLSFLEVSSDLAAAAATLVES